MKTLPILFNSEMVRAILSGAKTQTRRPVKPQPPADAWEPIYHAGGISYCDHDPKLGGANHVQAPCPFGVPGDWLWVRETFSTTWSDHTIYRADGGSAKAVGYDSEPKWKPSIHMPRSASRITLEVTNVHVERVQDISEVDAVAEGCWDIPGIVAIDNFADAWNDIYGDWADNPWAWVVSFKALLVSQ